MSKSKPCHLVAESHPVDRLIRNKEMCQLTGYHRVTLFRWCKKNIFIPPIRKNGRIIGWRESDYKKWLKNQ